jgi:anti-sigma-K factor RskA
MTDHQEEMLALHALRTLSPEEVRLLESESRYDAKMRDTLAEFEETAAEIATLVPEEAPPPELRAELLKQVKLRAKGSSTAVATTFRLLRSPIIAWAAAAAIAVGAASLWTRNQVLGKRINELAMKEAEAQGQVKIARDAEAELKKRLVTTQTQVSDLTTQLRQTNEQFQKVQVAALRTSPNANNRYASSVAAVAWSQEKQEGVLKIEDMPAVQPNKDYQLWVICKQCKHPVNAGVVKVDADGTTTITFKPVHHIAEPLRFALSVEAQGGVPEKSSDGPIIFASK